MELSKEEIRKVAEIVEDLIENEDDIFWDSFQVRIEMRKNEDSV